MPPDDGLPTGLRADLHALAARVAALPPSAGSTVVVAVDGPSGAGKTTFADRLGALLGAPVLHLDDLYPGWDGLDAAVPRLVDGVLAPLAAGRPAGYRRWDWAQGVDGEHVDVPAVPLLVVDGVGSGARACAPYLALLVWLDGPESWRKGRAIERDGEAYALNWHRWAAQERAHFSREGTRGRADVVLDNPVGPGATPG